ncbi:MAG: family 16 glycoside hydrolase [Planctomycetota bacterium]
MNAALHSYGFCCSSVTSVSSILLATALACAVFAGHSAAAEPNYDESAVRPFTLPDPLAGPDGLPAANVEAWRTKSRPHQLQLLEKYVYGKQLPAVPVAVVGDSERVAVTLPSGVPAIRIQARLRLGETPEAPTTDVLLYLPRGLSQSDGPVPVFLNLNFTGNQAECADPGIRLCTAWLPDDITNGIVDNRATEASRGVHARRLPVAALLPRGYGLATACYGDVFPDRPDGREASALQSLGRPVTGDLPADEPGAIATWAWQLSRILDWLVTLPEVDARRVMVVGHSRNGKAALWAGACDERFALVISNESGCAGAALSRRNYGEAVGDITQRFPHWFCPAFATYADREAELPCDQHCLLALVAPRPLYAASAVEDRWADPRGEFLSLVAAEPAWKLFGITGLGTTEYPPVDTPIGQANGYHVRSGTHDLLEYDWQRFADFADRTLLEKPPHKSPLSAAQEPFHPQQSPLPVLPPPGAIVLVAIDAAAAPPKFVSMAGGPIDWQVKDGGLVVNTTSVHANHIVSTATFRDADIHAEFVVAPEAKGNSGLYIHGHYEMQIFDSYGVEPPTEQDEGGLYRFSKPLVNAALPPGQWQVYDIRFIAPRRDAKGAVTKPGSITAWLNGKRVQDGLTFTEPRSPYIPYKHGVTDYLRGVEKRLLETGAGPLFLQDHGSPARFRNVWIRPLDH